MIHCAAGVEKSQSDKQNDKKCTKYTYMRNTHFVSHFDFGIFFPFLSRLHGNEFVVVFYVTQSVWRDNRQIFFL